MPKRVDCGKGKCNNTAAKVRVAALEKDCSYLYSVASAEINVVSVRKSVHYKLIA